MLSTSTARRSLLRGGIYDVFNQAAPVQPSHWPAEVSVNLEAHDCGVDRMVMQLRDQIRWHGRMDYLRIHGPGDDGIQTVSCSDIPNATSYVTSRSIISGHNFDRISAALYQLREGFAPGAVVWLGGCRPGPGSNRLIEQLVDLWNVVVTIGNVAAPAGITQNYVSYSSTVTGLT